jgi:hypothetical protein
LVNFAAAQHNASVSSNFCKELDLARFYQRAFFCPDFCLPDHRSHPIGLLLRQGHRSEKTGNARMRKIAFHYQKNEFRIPT